MQARALRTRRAILDVASMQFDEIGYAETSVNTIVASGALTKGAIYFHFSSKAAIALCLVENWIDEVQQVISATSGAGLSAADRIRVVFSDFARLITTDTQLRAGMKLTFEPAVDQSLSFTQWIDAVGELVDNAVDAGELGDCPRTQRLAWNLCSGITGAAHASGLTDDDIDLLVRIDDQVAAQLDSLQPPLWPTTGDGSSGLGMLHSG